MDWAERGAGAIPALRARRAADRLLGLGTAAMLSACAAQRLDWRTVPTTFSVGEVGRYGQGIVSVDSAGGTVTFALGGAGAAEIALVAVAPDGRVHPLYPLQEGESSRFGGGAHAVTVPVVVPEWRARPSAPATASDEAWRNQNRCEAIARAVIGANSRSPEVADSSRGTPPHSQMNDPTVGNVSQMCSAPPVGRGSPAPLAAGRFEPEDDVIVLVVSEAPISAEQLRRRVAGLRLASEADLRALPRRIAGDPSGPFAGYYSRRFPTPREQEQR